MPEDLQKSVGDFVTHANNAPLLKALRAAGEYESVELQDSEQLLAPKSYDRAAHNHLIVIGVADADPLLQKVRGFDVSLNPADQSAYAQGWGYLHGDLGWIECDRNPFLHSSKIKSAPEGTILVKITGTSVAGVAAALRAFQGGQLGGFVPAGKVTRPRETLLDRDPDPTPPPGTMQATVESSPGKFASLAGWYDLPENEYRAVEEAAGAAPARMWRCKYLAPGFLEEKSIVRWLGGVHRMAFGNAADIIQFASPEAAGRAVENMAQHDGFKKSPERPDVWVEPQATDEVIDQPYWKVYLTSRGRYAILSTLPVPATVALADLSAAK